MATQNMTWIESKCMKCEDKITYPLGTPWVEVNRMTHKHLAVCHQEYQ
jgi:hypothetical protein